MKEKNSYLDQIYNHSWPPWSIVEKLIEASDILFDDKDYDGHGWEQLHSARVLAKRWLKQQKQPDAESTEKSE